MKDWKWQSSIWDFVSIVQWAAVLHTVAQNHEPDGWKIVADPKLTREYAREHGITRGAVVREMARAAHTPAALSTEKQSGIGDIDAHENVLMDGVER